MPGEVETARPRTLLIVEDTEEHVAALEIALSSISGLAVSSVSSAEEALRLLEGPPGDAVCAIVTDLHLGEMDGFQLIERLRANGRFGNLPIIVISGDTNPETPVRVARLGADAFFAKPYSPFQVRERVKVLIHGNSSTASG